MFANSNLFRRFTRTPREGGRKDDPMPEAQTPTVEPRDEVSRQLSTLAEAMRQLAESHKTLLDAAKAQPAPVPAPAPAPTAPPVEIGGDPVGGGARPGAVVDYSRLSPVQQIALGLKDSAPRPAQGASTGAD